MKKTGVVIDYNGYNGIILAEANEKYILLREEVVSDEELYKLDKVMFTAEKKEYEDSEYNVARFVRKLKVKSDYSNHKFF